MAAFEQLKDDALWMKLLAENVKWASCEGFLQSSLLGAFNLQEGADLIADREKRFAYDGGERTVQPDLLPFLRDNQLEWWASRGYGQRYGNPRPLVEMCRGLVQLKVVWTKENSTASARPECKALSIRTEIGDLLRYRSERSDVFTYYGVFVAGMHSSQLDWEASLSDVESQLTRVAQLSFNQCLPPLTLLNGVVPPSGPISAGYEKAWCWLYLLVVAPVPGGGDANILGGAIEVVASREVV